jgi:hypothetical protein
MSLGGGSSSSKQQSQQTSNPVLDQQGIDMRNANGVRALGIADSPFQPYGGQFTAPLTGNEQLGVNLAPGAFGAGAGAFGQAQNTAADLSGYQPPMASTAYARAANLGFAPQISPTSINRGDVSNINPGDLLSGIAKYQDPYTTDVINAGLNDNERSRQMQRVNDQQAATAAGAFGGSRAGVADSLTNGEYDRNAQSFISNLRDQGFRTAAGLSQDDAARAQAAAAANQGADLSVAGQNANLGFGTKQYNANNILDFLKTKAANENAIRLSNASAANDMSRFNASNDLAGAGVRQTAANSLGALGGQQQGSFLNALAALMTTGSAQRGVQQSDLDAQFQEFLRMINDPYQKQQLLNQSLGLVPVNLGQTSQGTSSGKSSAFNFSAGINANPISL